MHEVVLYVNGSAVIDVPRSPLNSNRLPSDHVVLSPVSTLSLIRPLAYRTHSATTESSPDRLSSTYNGVQATSESSDRLLIDVKSLSKRVIGGDQTK